MSINSLIRKARERLGLTEEEFAAKLGVTRGAVQHWEREGGTAPARRNQKAVADLIGITVAQLMSGEDDVEPGPKIGGQVPLLSDVQAGAYTTYVDNFHPGDGGEELVTTSVPVRRYTFALRVSGDSMEPDFQHGMILIVEPEMEAQPGDFVIAKNADDETTFKQLIKDGGEWYLKPMNERYPIKALGESKVIGVVRAVERRFR